MSVPNPEKGARYLASLDQALCNGNWAEISELARKVDKHAPERSCLTLAARAESQVTTASHRPTSASSVASVSIHGLGELVPRLVEATSAARASHADDAYVASVCLAEIHWLREAPVEALKVLSDIGNAPSGSRGGPAPLGWLEVCEVKAQFITASCQESSGQAQEARDTYQSAVRLTPGYRTPELRRWTERLLARACMYSVQKMPSPSLHEYGRTYNAFKAWSAFWQRSPASSASTSAATTRLDVPRRQVWKAYYDLLSTILQRGLLVNAHGSLTVPGPENEDEQLNAKIAQRAEMKQVETTYETLLLAETQFPKASQTNLEVEEWVEQVMSNWRIFSGPSWVDFELGKGGKRAVSQTVLDILYRAATKTFHSTPILRHLFTVHAARGEFDLAMHAFNSYTAIIDRGKARAQKTGKHEIGFDDDDTAMLTAAEAVRLLCRYGDREHSQKALEITKSMQKWMDQSRPSTAHATQANWHGEDEDEHRGPSTASLLKPATLAAVYRAMGIGQAHWAQVTYESETRPGLFAEANNNLRQAQKSDETSIETAHALAFVLAQMRDVSGALDVIRTALARSEQPSNGDAQHQSKLQRQKRLFSLWHLLALCLTAEDQYEAAVHMCEAAYQQFGDLDRFFGTVDETTPINSEKPAARRASRGLIDQFDNCEKESLVQVKMTQIILFELMEGADDAVDQTDELFSLYSRLFGKPEQVVADIVARPPQTAATQTPSRIGGTLKSITGSIRPRSVRSFRSSGEKDAARQRSVISEESSSTKPTENELHSSDGANIGVPIAITVTNENGVESAEKPHRHHHLPHLPFKGRGHRSGSMRSRSPARIAPNNSSDKPPLGPPNAASGNEPRPDQPLGEMIHNAPSTDWPPPAGHEDQPPEQDVRLPAPHPASASAVPEPQLAPMHERRHKLAVLVNTWLFSAELYTRAETYDDAENLINDAVKLTETLERELAASEAGSNARRLYHKGWGKGKSIDQLWADVWSTKAQLALARDLPYDAMAAYEQALFHEPDHASSIIGLSAILMDIFEEKLPAEPPLTSTQPLPTASGSLIKESRPALTRPSTATTLPSRRPSFVVEPEPVETKERKIEPSPGELNRLAARDRAYMLLSNLTKQGAGWDDSEAWLTLARAHELSREIGKAKQALWWVVELENNRPIRPWKDACPGGLTV